MSHLTNQPMCPTSIGIFKCTRESDYTNAPSPTALKGSYNLPTWVDMYATSREMEVGRVESVGVLAGQSALVVSTNTCVVCDSFSVIVKQKFKFTFERSLSFNLI